MGLFGFGKSKIEKNSNEGCGCKKESSCGCTENIELKAKCDCGSDCGISDITGSRIIVLGACCKKSTETFENVKLAVKELGLSDEVANIGDMAEIAKYGVMQTPALVINSKVISYGKALKVEEAKKLIEKNI